MCPGIVAVANTAEGTCRNLVSIWQSVIAVFSAHPGYNEKSVLGVLSPSGAVGLGYGRGNSYYAFCK